MTVRDGRAPHSAGTGCAQSQSPVAIPGEEMEYRPASVLTPGSLRS
jgi:hypothetical protein